MPIRLLPSPNDTSDGRSLGIPHPHHIPLNTLDAFRNVSKCIASVRDLTKKRGSKYYQIYSLVKGSLINTNVWLYVDRRDKN
jgi:hypothetical protein